MQEDQPVFEHKKSSIMADFSCDGMCHSLRTQPQHERELVNLSMDTLWKFNIAMENGHEHS
jgi:hypothetical protein